MMVSESATVSGFILLANHRSSTYAITYDAVYRLAGRPQCDEGFGCSAALLPERSQRICPERSQRVRSAFSISAGGVGFLLGVKSVLRMGSENSQSRLAPSANALARRAIRFKFQISI